MPHFANVANPHVVLAIHHKKRLLDPAGWIEGFGEGLAT